MAISIDDLHVQTQAPPESPSDSKTRSAPGMQVNVKAEIEKMRERELRLRAD